MHHPGGVHCAERGQRCDGDALECSAAARPELLDDLYQRWPADVFTDNERPAFEDSRIQNLRSAEPGDPLRCGDLLQKAAPDQRVRGRRQKLDRRPASSRIHRQEHDALPALPEAAEQAVYTHLARIRVAQGKHFRHCGLTGCHPAIVPRRLSARHNSVSPVVCRSFPCGRLLFRGTALSRPRPPGAAPDLSIGITEVLVTGQEIARGRRSPRWQERQWCSPYPL